MFYNRQFKFMFVCKKCEDGKFPCNCVVKGFKYILMLFSLIALIFIILFVYKGIKFLNKDGRTIQITGKGEVEARSNEASISFVLREKNNSTDKSKNIISQNKINSQMGQLVLLFQELNINEKDIKTEDYQIQPISEWKTCDNNLGSESGCQSKYNLVGYEISESVTVKVLDTQNTEKVLSLLVKNNVTEVSGPNFTIGDTENLKNEARDKAIIDAKNKAGSLSKSLGIELKKIISFYENSDYPNFQPSYEMTKNMWSGLSTSHTQPQSVSAENIQEGSKKIISNVSITFEIED